MRSKERRDRSLGPKPRDFGPSITDAEFAAFRELIRRTAGITLSDMKRQLLCSRLGSRLRRYGFTTFSEYYAYLRTEDPSGAERRQMVNCITTNKTHFFREPHHFDFLRERVLPGIVARATHGEKRRIRIWSAGCSTGEEPYSIAMTLAEALEPKSSWDVKILASDIDTNVLDRAEGGVFSRASAADLPPEAFARWFHDVPSQSGFVRASDELRAMLVFRRINLIREPWPINTSFDVIFCRNVTIYFDRETQQRLYERFARQLRPGGYLIAGHSENLSWLNHLFVSIGKTVYQRGAEAAAVRATSAPPRSGGVARSPRTSSPEKAPSQTVNLLGGAVFASREPAVVRTLLGSCVSVCLHDPVARVGGMNHFMLPNDTHTWTETAAYGVRAMELLIHRVSALGGQRGRFQARVFGGANVLKGLGQVGDANARFALEFLERENIPVLERRIGGELPLRVVLHTDTGEARVRAVSEEREQAVAQDTRHRLEVERALARSGNGKAVSF